MGIILKRRECRQLSTLSHWALVYGRRKVGKTFLLKHCVNHDVYFSVTSTGKAVSEGEIYSAGEAVDEVVRVLRRGGVAVVDEFQRLPPDYYDVLASLAPDGVLIAAGSSYGVVHKVFDKSSPLLGHMLPVKMDIMAYEDVLAQVADPVLAMLYRDPWVISLAPSYGEFAERLPQLALVARGLVGEVFSEEGRGLTETYWRAVLLVAEGYWKSAEIAGALALKGGVASASSILYKLAQIGLLRSIPTLGRENYYMVRSPALSLILYAEAKYAVGETGVSPPQLPVGRELQFTIGEMMANRHGAAQHYSPREDIDVVLVKGKRRIWAYEVKLGPFTLKEAADAVAKLKKAAEKAGLISLTERPPEVADEVLGPRELVELAKKLAEI